MRESSEPKGTNIDKLKNVLLIFVRNPELGKVKTRLARALGDAKALQIYQILLKKTRATATGVAAERQLYYTENVPENDDWPSDLFQRKCQSSGDLGTRMASAFYDAFQAGAGKVLIIGSDCPELSSTIVETAFAMLDREDFVIGPAHDGGYYLLGMREMEGTIFHDINWSTETVRSRTLEKIADLGKTCGLLPMLTDMDEAADWEQYLERLKVTNH